MSHLKLIATYDYAKLLRSRFKLGIGLLTAGILFLLVAVQQMISIALDPAASWLLGTIFVLMSAVLITLGTYRTIEEFLEFAHAKNEE